MSNDLQAFLADHFTPGNVIFGDYWRQHDLVHEFNWNGGNWFAVVEQVRKVGECWESVEGWKRRHSTLPNKKDRVVFHA